MSVWPTFAIPVIVGAEVFTGAATRDRRHHGRLCRLRGGGAVGVRGGDGDPDRVLGIGSGERVGLLRRLADVLARLAVGVAAQPLVGVRGRGVAPGAVARRQDQPHLGRPRDRRQRGRDRRNGVRRRPGAGAEADEHAAAPRARRRSRRPSDGSVSQDPDMIDPSAQTSS